MATESDDFDVTLYREASNRRQKEIFREVYERHYPRVYRLAYSLCGQVAEAEDIVQEVFIATLKGLPNFKGESRLGTWLYRITTLVSGRFIARRSRNQSQEIDLERLSSSAMADSELLANQVVQAISKLSFPLRTVLSLVAIEGLSHQDAAEVLGLPVGTIGSRLHTARKQLAQHL